MKIVQNKIDNPISNIKHPKSNMNDQNVHFQIFKFVKCCQIWVFLISNYSDLQNIRFSAVHIFKFRVVQVFKVSKFQIFHSLPPQTSAKTSKSKLNKYIYIYIKKCSCGTRTPLCSHCQPANCWPPGRQLPNAAPWTSRWQIYQLLAPVWACKSMAQSQRVWVASGNALLWGQQEHCQQTPAAQAGWADVCCTTSCPNRLQGGTWTR